MHDDAVSNNKARLGGDTVSHESVSIVQIN